MNKALVDFSKILGEHKDNIKAMNDVVLSKLAKQMDTKAGLIFLKEDIDTDSPLKVSSAYGVHSLSKISKLSFDIGQGIAGVVLADEQSKVYREDLPKDFFKITSSLGEAKPRELLLVPIVFEDLKIGVIELATFGTFEQYHVEFLERLAELLASKNHDAVVTAKK